MRKFLGARLTVLVTNCSAINGEKKLALKQLCKALCTLCKTLTNGKITETAADYYAKNFLHVCKTVHGHNESNRQHNDKK